MDKETRNKLRNAIVQCRKLLEQDVLDQLEGTFGIHRQGRIEPESAVPHLDDEGLEARRRAVAAVEHIQGYGVKPADAVDQFQREVAFTHLNRLCAFKILERRGLLDETVSRGTNSNGFKVYLAGHPEDERLWRTGDEHKAYKHFLFDVCARLSDEIKVLFDTQHVSSYLFPSRRALEGVLLLINAPELADIWDSDETIGWIYQYFTPKELREKARKESAAPRNSYELAFRNQFYTPRYVVEFLVDNTLGRLWYEMRKGDTALMERCQYMVRRKRPVFLAPGEKPPESFRVDGDYPSFVDGAGEMWVQPSPDIEDLHAVWQYALTVDGYSYAKERLGVDCGDLANERLGKYHETKKWEGTFEQLRCCLFFEQRRYHHFGREPEGEEANAIKALHRAICDRWNLETEHIPHREKKLPWEIKVLDPASGSGHFLLYAFDLLETIYEEAYEDPDIGPQVRALHPNREAYAASVPAMILRHSLHGIDIDLRSTQMAALALWMRAQRSYQRLGLNGERRPRIERTNIVCAEPMPGDEALLDEFCESLSPSLLGDLVRQVWDKMKLAGEAGSLLKIEEEIRDVVSRAQETWRKAPKGYKISLFDGTVQRPVEQAEFDFSEVTGPEFWLKAEALLVDALELFASRAANGREYGRQLFKDDAEQGFAFIKLCRKRYDVVLMNPPFGWPSTPSKGYVETTYNDCKEDVDAGFVKRGVELLSSQGFVGVIINRTQFFKPTLRRWRETTILGESCLDCAADLGYGVLDTALVEAAMYTLRRPITRGRAASFFRLLKSENKDAALSALVQEYRSGARAGEMFVISPESFQKLPETRISYWAGQAMLSVFERLPRFEGRIGTAKQGLSTGDDFRFLRTAWEVPPAQMRSVLHLNRADGDDADWTWAPVAKGGEYLPYFQDLHLVILWRDDGAALKQYPGSAVRNPTFYFQPGITYSERTASGFCPRVLPRGCIFTQIGPLMAVKDRTMILPVLGLLMSRPVAAMVEMMVEAGDAVHSGSAARHYTQNVAGSIPIPHMTNSERDALRQLVADIWELKRADDAEDETGRYFLAPALLQAETTSGSPLAELIESASRGREDRHLSVLAKSWDVEDIARRLYQLDRDAIGEIDSEFGPHPELRPAKLSIDERGFAAAYRADVEDIIQDEVQKSGGSRSITKKVYFADRKLELLSATLDTHPRVLVETRRRLRLLPEDQLTGAVRALISYALGGVFGRWDVRVAVDASLAPKLQDPFDPLPPCPPGMLVGSDGLPAHPGGIVNEEWLRARPNAITRPPEGSVSRPTISDDEYPLRIDWDGILVDDPDHQDDIVRRVREVLELLWGDRAEAIEQEACEILGVKDLREYFRNPKHFWDHHVKRYSKSRRKAPIYWLLQSPRRHYALWVYYHRLDRDMLYKALRNYVDPKLRLGESHVRELRDRLAGTPEGRERKALEKQIDDQETVVNDVLDFKERLEKVAALGLDPDLNDGVILNIAPLQELVPWKEPKQYWDDLLAGKYEWSTIGKQLREKGLVRG